MDTQIIGSPNNINVLLHYYVTNADHPRITSKAVQETISWYLESGVFVYTPSGELDITDLGRAWVELLCRTKMPRIIFVDEYDQSIFD